VGNPTERGVSPACVTETTRRRSVFFILLPLQRPRAFEKVEQLNERACEEIMTQPWWRYHRSRIDLIKNRLRRIAARFCLQLKQMRPPTLEDKSRKESRYAEAINLR
jgi:hypothetical protein